MRHDAGAAAPAAAGAHRQAPMLCSIHKRKPLPAAAQPCKICQLHKRSAGGARQISTCHRHMLWPPPRRTAGAHVRRAALRIALLWRWISLRLQIVGTGRGCGVQASSGRAPGSLRGSPRSLREAGPDGEKAGAAGCAAAPPALDPASRRLAAGPGAGCRPHSHAEGCRQSQACGRPHLPAAAAARLPPCEAEGEGLAGAAAHPSACLLTPALQAASSNEDGMAVPDSGKDTGAVGGAWATPCTPQCMLLPAAAALKGR